MYDEIVRDHYVTHVAAILLFEHFKEFDWFDVIAVRWRACARFVCPGGSLSGRSERTASPR